MAALQVSENWDDDFEFQLEKRATVKTEISENWDDDFEYSRQSPKKIIQRHREESWDEDDDENGEFGLFAEEDHTVTARSQRAAFARLSMPLSMPGYLHPSRSPTSSVFSLPTTIHAYSSTAHLRPASAFAFIPPSHPVHKERETRRLRKKSRPIPQAVLKFVEIPSQERPSFSDVDLPRPTSQLCSRRTSKSDLSIDQRPPGNLIGNISANPTDLCAREEVSRGTNGKGKFSFVPSGTKLSTLTTIATPIKLVKRNTFGFVHLGRGFGGHGGGEDEVVGRSERRNGMLEKGKENEHEDHPKEKGARSFMGNIRRISLVSVGVVGRHRKTRSVGSGVSPARVLPLPTSLPSASSFASQVSSTMTMTNTGSSEQCASSHTTTADLRRAASLSSPNGGGSGPDDLPATPVSYSGSPHPCPRPISSSAKRRRRTLSKSISRPRESENSCQELKGGGLKAFQQEQASSFNPSEGREPKTPTRSTFSTAAAMPIPLLPPIELQPPSPPRMATTSHVQRRSRVYSTNKLVDGLELPALGVTPTLLPSRDHASPGAVGVGGILPLPSLSPSKLSPGKSPSHSQQSVSLGRSTAVASGGDESTGFSFTTGSGGSGLARRNTLGDLKIPAKISQAQVGLRRDLGMVREFASNVEQLKELQHTYNTLVGKVQALLDSGSLDVAVPSSQVTYKTLVEAFWSIDSKYKVSWEYAELLIELGSGSGGGDGDGDRSDVMSATTSVSASVIQQYLDGAGGNRKMFSLNARERAITLAGDESEHSSATSPLSPTTHNEAQTFSQSQPSSAVVCSSMPGCIPSANPINSGDPPLASSPSMSWRASAGRHDLSQRQLVLLREMLNNNGSATSDNEKELSSPPPPPPPPPQLSILAEDPHPSSASSLYPSSRSQFVNRDWRWGDARNSTIALSEQESGIGTEEGGRRDRKMEKEKRRSGMLGMSGIRDMLRSLRKDHVEELQHNGNSNSGEVQSDHHYPHGRLPTLAHPVTHSTTSLSTQSSIGIHKQAQAQQQQQQDRLPILRIPSQIRRRGRSSTGPELMMSNKKLSPTSFPSSFTVPKPTRRPSLASIFRIGNSKTRPVSQDVILPAAAGAGAEDSATLSSASYASEHDLPAAQCSSSFTGTGGDDRNGTGEEEEDWDRMDSASDLEATTAKALENVDEEYDISATVRGRRRIETKIDEKMKGGVSPYQSSYENDQHDLLPQTSLPASSSSTALGNFLARHSIIPKRSFNVSQSSIRSSGGGDGQHSSKPSRLSRYSNFEEQPSDPASVELATSLCISSSKSVPTTTQSKLPNAKSGSVRLVAPHLAASSLLPRGQESSLSDPKPGMIMTAENIKPLLENAKEVHVKLHECIIEIRALIDDGTAAVGTVQAGP